MNAFHCLVLVAAAMPLSVLAQSFHDRHVVFNNSAAEKGHEYSEASDVVAPSTVDAYDGKFPVDHERFVSPPNSLRLTWTSATGGDWRMGLEIPRLYARTFHFEGDAVAFWIYSDFEITRMNSPLVFLRDIHKKGTGTLRLADEGRTIPAGRWVRLVLPLDAFNAGLYHGTDDPKFIFSDMLSINFMQGLDDGEKRTIWVDDVHVIDSKSEDKEPPPVPQGLSAKGFDRHVDLAWQGVEASDLLTYRIYRSVDGRDFEPLGTQQGQWSRYEDFIGESGREARYRVTAIDLAGNESAPSEAASASTREFSDDELLDMVQEACFRYYWEAAHPAAGLAPEVLPGDNRLIALGGNGFGVMALLAATERQFITRQESVDRMLTILRFLDRADRFHGVWPHFLDAETGKTIPFFGRYDNGGDLVETAFMMQGLLAARQYFTRDNAQEREIRDTVTRFWREIEWDWYRRDPDSKVLYWHWSPDAGFRIQHPLVGWNETMIIYLLAIASPTHPVPASLYHTGWAGTDELNVHYRQNWSRTTQGDHYINGNSYYGIKLDVGSGSGSDMFFTHFSYMGFDPRGIRDRYTNYFRNNRAIALIDRAYCMENPRGFKGYGADTWGLSAGINNGGGRPLPRDDNGTINVMAALSSMPYTPDESMDALRHYYRDLGGKVWGIYGFHDGFNETQEWFEEVYMALNQAPITVMIENHRSGLIWKLFMANPEIKPALDAMGFVPDPEGDEQRSQEK